MIVTVTLNAALDVTYHVDALVPHASHRVKVPAARAGGKGVNVARVLHALGEDVVATGLAGGATGAAVRADLAAAGVPEAMVEIAGETRRTVTVVDTADGPELNSNTDATVLNEPGPVVSAGEWERFCDTFPTLIADANAVVLAGSLPPGIVMYAYTRLATMAAHAGVPVILDSSGDALIYSLVCRPAVVTPNRDELAAVMPGFDVVTGARALLQREAEAVVVSCGADGLVAVTLEGTWHASPPEVLRGNPTGAGDAAVAALVRGVVAGTPWPERVADALSLSAAAVLAPLAGDFDNDTYRRLKTQVRVADWVPAWR